MLAKLLKYDISAGARKVPISYIAIAALFLIGLVARFLENPQIVAAACFLLFLAGLAAVLLAFVFTVVRYHKGLFGNEGYLTQTLPVGKGKLVLSKLISAYLWTIFSTIAMAAAWAGALVIINDFDLIKEIVDFLFGSTFTPLVIFALVSSAVQLFAVIGEVYFAITLANTRPFINNNILFSVVFFFVINMAVGILEIIAMLLIPLGLKFTETGVVWATETMLGSMMLNMEALGSSQPLLSGISIGVGSCFADLAAGIGLLLAARWLLTHKTSVK